METGRIRKKDGFTMVMNEVARDKRLSLRAKGLYLLVQSYITMPDKEWKKKDFMEIAFLIMLVWKTEQIGSMSRIIAAWEEQ